MSDGTKSTEQGLSDHETAHNASQDEFEGALSKAMFEGNQAEVERLMASTEVSEEEEAVSTDTQATTGAKASETSEKDEKIVEAIAETGQKTEAATSAASSVPVVEDIEAIKRELHQYKSDAGRVPHLQRRMTELERELRASQARNAATTQQGDGKTPSSNDAVLDPETQAEIDALKEIDPVLAKTIERVAKTAVASSRSAVEELTKQEQEAEDFRFYVDQKSRLAEAIPQHEAIFATNEWKAWKDTLTPNRKAMAESGYADEVVQAIYAFAADMQRLNPQAVAAPVQTTQVVNTPEKTEVTNARERKMATSAEARNPTAKATEQFDEDAYFREMYVKLGKQNHILP